MEQNLRVLFDRALDDEPVLPPGDPARLAMAQGRRIRRRRGLLAAGAVAAAAVAVAVTVNAVWAPAAPPPGFSAAAENPACAAPDGAFVVAVFLTQGVTAAQRSDLQAALQAYPAVRDLQRESRQEAFARFQQLWKDDPNFVQSVDADSLPESFRVTLAPAAYPDFEARFHGRPGVQDIVAPSCPGAGR
ncbi:permease-like cell division protein FtsX [Actinoplanes sp. KI2]|uniref:permease-like cell division protein FtsX n=1 Tax=Actinoplanes sp. KI2 TaxID=2983315 RepID=UPI0021D5F9A8|nr:permease-like cell division protein FtsX [Actinoplanes sp. KI2]MCU7722553.1 permease-like cell division protein FtsX [Actinoplanes sp. KI2]